MKKRCTVAAIMIGIGGLMSFGSYAVNIVLSTASMNVTSRVYIYVTLAIAIVAAISVFLPNDWIKRVCSAVFLTWIAITIVVHVFLPPDFSGISWPKEKQFFQIGIGIFFFGLGMLIDNIWLSINLCRKRNKKQKKESKEQTDNPTSP